MPFGPWDTVVNAVLLVVWIRVWTDDHRSFVFNPYVSPVAGVSEYVMGFLRPVFGNLPPRLVATVAMLFLLVFRGFTVPPSSPGVLSMGFEIATPGSGLWRCVLFSALSFGLFLFTVWGLCLFYLRPSASRAHLSHAHEALRFLGRPFTDLPSAVRPPVLLAFGMIMGGLLDAFGRPVAGLPLPVANSLADQPAILAAIGLALSAAARIAGILGSIRSLVILLIIGSLVSMFANSRAIHSFCRDWLDLLLGPARRFPIRLGMFDLMPLVFLIALGLAQAVLQEMIYRAYVGVF